MSMGLNVDTLRRSGDLFFPPTPRAVGIPMYWGLGGTQMGLHDAKYMLLLPRCWLLYTKCLLAAHGPLRGSFERLPPDNSAALRSVVMHHV